MRLRKVVGLLILLAGPLSLAGAEERRRADTELPFPRYNIDNPPPDLTLPRGWAGGASTAFSRGSPLPDRPETWIISGIENGNRTVLYYLPGTGWLSSLDYAMRARPGFAPYRPPQ